MNNCPPSVEDALKARPFDQRRLLEVLYRHGLRWMTRLVSRMTRGRPELLEDLTAEVFRRLIEKDLDGARPVHLDCPAAWLARVITNEAHNALRHILAQKRGGGTTHDNLEESGAVELRASTPPVDVAEHIDTKRQWSHIAQTALHGDIPGRPRLGFLGYYLARHIEERHVVEAKQQPDRAKAGVMGGLLRSIEDTWSRLSTQVMPLFPDGVDEDDEGRLALAFVLRSAHPGPASEWAKVDKKDVATAKDTVRKWAERGREHVAVLVQKAEGAR